ncbi:HBS1 protein [Chondrus crispus]|uniref:HBS1 protein n=1 Tax=Chondrus crispus TaxID=2769 RepID=R7Q4J1_CHOCR|nr:HBS1 protein [Chondrus crispus]CDF32380.1 HBS1 protein [Chondrus crispus]|eukprot:XP_005712045.1 HBS1 protein [Chondrus crispus]
MSRHRHIRNLCYDDYDDYADDYDDYYSEPEPEPEPEPGPDDESLLADLAAQFRRCLNDDTIQEATIDAAIVAADYDVDAALELLRQQRAADAAAATAAMASLQLSHPSPIARMLEEDAAPAEPPRMPEPADTREPLVLSGGNALLPREPADISPFRFDKPSPDDVLLAKKGGAGRKKLALRMPKVKPGSRNAVIDAGKVNGVAEVPKKKEPPAVVKPAKKPPQAAGMNSKVKQRVKTADFRTKVKEGCSSVSVVVAGHVDAGKSTLLGHILRLQEGTGGGKGKRRRKEQDLAWGTDEDAVERERGVTIDIATRVFKTEGRNARTYAMIDAPGHRDFVPAMILGATQASAALLVVDASPGEFEAGFSEDGQTKEHTLVLKSLGISRLIVVVNKMDVINFEEDRFEEVAKAVKNFLRDTGWKVDRSVSYVAASGRSGANLVQKPDAEHPLMKWYKGPTVLEAIERLPSADALHIAEVSAQPTRLIVSDFFRSATLGGNGAVTGRLLCGTIAPKDKLSILPGGALAMVKNLETGSGERNGVAVAGVDSLPVSIGLMDLPDGVIVNTGSVLCDPEAPVPVAVRFTAQIITVTTGTPLIQGSKGVLHIGGGAEAASISKLCEYKTNYKKGSHGGKKKRRPRRLVKGDTAVVEITCDRGVPMEKSTNVKALSRFALRQNGKTVAVGIVTDVLKSEAIGTPGESAIE